MGLYIVFVTTNNGKWRGVTIKWSKLRNQEELLLSSSLCLYLWLPEIGGRRVVELMGGNLRVCETLWYAPLVEMKERVNIERGRYLSRTGMFK